MSSEQLSCPGCSGPLEARQVEGFRQYGCSECGGVVIGTAVLRQLAGPAGQHIWTAEPAPSGASPLRCPFCSQQMEGKTIPAGNAATCKVCEVVWLDKQAVSALPVHAPAPDGQPSLESEAQAARCEQCGAPIANSWDEHCRYCGAAIHAPTKVVVLPSGSPADPLRREDESWGGKARPGLFGDVIRALGRPVD
jgi:Zn-finger nucleic acid-binding protein